MLILRLLWMLMWILMLTVILLTDATATTSDTAATQASIHPPNELSVARCYTPDTSRRNSCLVSPSSNRSPALHWLHCTALLCTTLHCTALHCYALHCTALHCTALHCTVKHYTILHCTSLHYLLIHSICNTNTIKKFDNAVQFSVVV